MRSVRMGLQALAGVLVLGFFGCAQQVGDIDRTQPNKLKKADLQGVWFMMETVTDIPATSASTFIGETGKMEKIVWQIEEGYLLAVRAYPRVPGSDDVDGGVDTNAPEYQESPVAAFPILSHFDIKRAYDAATGEQTNVFEENTYDRPWYEREFMRIDWSRNVVTNFEFVTELLLTPIQASYTVDQERGEDGSIYQEREAGVLTYFDVPRRLLAEPDYWGCEYALWWGWGTEDCTAAEIELVTSFARTERRRDYEPLPYSDQDMSRFGYFRSERYVHDPQRGVLESNRIKQANRHNPWKETYEKNPDGSLERDGDGKLIPIPMAQREPRTITYYMSQTFPDDDLIEAATIDSMAQWDDVGREAMALAKGVSKDEIGTIFALCHNPVQEGDDKACGDVGFTVREGDLRHSTLHWVEADQIQGPLGYGPSATDPETGEIVSGRAYVYGSGLSTYATYGVDVIRFMNGDLAPEELVNAEHVRAQIQARADRATGLQKPSPRLKDVPLTARGLRNREKTVRREQNRTRIKPFDRDAIDARLKKAQEAGLGRGAAAGEQDKALAARARRGTDELDEDLRARFDRTSWLNPTHLKERQRRRRAAMARSVDFADMVDPNVIGIARAYAGRTDYDEIWRELRAEVYKATAIHEVGHTLGLRHNFQGTYDSMNYFDEYWALRPENMTEPQSMYDLFELTTPTEAQLDGRMLEYTYSSIMDYGITFNTDIKGLGRYDRAAIVYAYTAGTDDSGDFKPGFVQVFGKNKGELGRAGEILSAREDNGFRFDDPTTPIVPYLERWHYTTVMRSFPELSDAFDRDWMRLDNYIETRDSGDDGPVRVPYLFCSDEWVGALLSCQAFDHGADPYEMTKTVANNYRSYYYFNNFKRDRLGWDPWSALFGAFYNTFLPLSDWFQNWFLAPEGADDVMDNLFWMSIHVGINLIGESLATPPYGTFCTGQDGNLVHLSDDPGQGPGQTSDFFLDAYCQEGAPFFEVAQGDGRRRFSTYDVDSGYYFADKALEAGHYWTTLAAFWALVDPEAFVLGSDADVGTFAISYYDFFNDEVEALVNNVLTEKYSNYSPLLEATGVDGDNLTGKIHHRVLRPVFDPETGLSFDPETGRDVEADFGPDRRTTVACQPCDFSDDCHGYTGFIGGMYCQPIDDSGVFYCLQDCTDDPDLCADGHTCDDIGNCVPDNGECAVPDCSADSPHGACPTAESCVDGACEAIWPVVETDATFGIVDDMMFYGMLYTTFSFSTRYNDQINVFKMGSTEELSPGDGFEVVTFTDPISGDAYGALHEACPEGGSALTGGPTGLCDACDTSEECAGYTGDFSASFCQPIDSPDDEVWYCLVDCTETDAFCPEGTVCNSDFNCVPDDGQGLACEDLAGECGEDFPQGRCEDGATCVDGECLSETPQSAQCEYGLSKNTGAAQMVERGQILAQRYNDTLAAYYADDGSDAARELTLFRRNSRAQFDLETHIQKLNTIRASFAIFGKVY